MRNFVRMNVCSLGIRIFTRYSYILQFVIDDRYVRLENDYRFSGLGKNNKTKICLQKVI